MMSRVRRERLLVLATVVGWIAWAAQAHGAPAPLPEGNGLAAGYPQDVGISGHPDVIFADDFESYGSTSQLGSRWSGYYQANNTQITSDTVNVHAGGKALQFTLPQGNSEVSNAVVKNLPTTHDTLFVRVYTKFQAGYRVTSVSNHNGIRISAKYPGPGTPPNGSDFFLFLLQNAINYGEADPGYSHLYVYHPEQRSQWGDMWFPDGKVVPYDATPGDFGASFVARPNFIPARDRWYCYELMVQANTPGQRDGRAAFWIDGKLIADFQNLRMRDVASLKIDQIQLELHAQAGGSAAQVNRKWYDDLVVARSYIGPMSPVGGDPPPAAPRNLRIVAP